MSKTPTNRSLTMTSTRLRGHLVASRALVSAVRLRCMPMAALLIVLLAASARQGAVQAAEVSDNITFSGHHQDFGLQVSGSGTLTVSGTARIHVDVPLVGDTHADVTIPLQTIPFNLSPNPLNLVSDPSGSATVGYDDADLSDATLSDLDVDFRNGADWNLGVTPIVVQADVDFGILPDFGIDIIFDIGAALSTFNFAGSGPAVVSPVGGAFPSQQYFVTQPGTLNAAITGAVNARVESSFAQSNLGQVASLDQTTTDPGFILPGQMSLSAYDGPPATVVDTKLELALPLSLPFSLSESGTIIKNEPHADGSVDANINYSLAGNFSVSNLNYSLDSGPPGPRTDSILYGGNTLRFFNIDDPAFGSMTSIDYISDFSIQALAFDPDSGALYGGNATGRFFSVDDLSDGSSTSISTGANGFAVEALAFDPATGILYGGNSTGRFFRVDDLSDGSSTSISATGANGFGIEALAFDPVSGILYGGNSTGRFFRVDDLSNGSSTSISTGGFAIEALTFDPVSGILYGGNSTGRFFSIDPTDGSMVNIASPGGFSIAGLAFQPVPEPASLILASLGALSIAGFGWRRNRQPQELL